MGIGPGSRLTRVIATHFHPDHVGLAGWLTERFGLPLYMSAMEYFVSLSRQLDQSPPRIAAYQQFYRQGGLPEARAVEIVSLGQGYIKATTPLPPAYCRLAHGDRAEEALRHVLIKPARAPGQGRLSHR